MQPTSPLVILVDWVDLGLGTVGLTGGATGVVSGAANWGMAVPLFAAGVALMGAAVTLRQCRFYGAPVAPARRWLRAAGVVSALGAVGVPGAWLGGLMDEMVGDPAPVALVIAAVAILVSALNGFVAATLQEPRRDSPVDAGDGEF